MPSYSIDYFVLLVVKTLGALSIPILLFPLYKINHNLIAYKLPKFFEYSILIFCLFSFSPLYLGAEMMKNAYGLIGFAYFIYFVLQYINVKSTKYALLMGLVLLLIGFTHFGVFSVSIIFLIISLICIYKKQAIIPILSILLVGFLIVWMLDPFRAFNAINIFEKWFGFPWRIAYYPAGIVNFIVNILIALLIFFIIKTKKIEKTQKQILTILLCFIVLLALPILKFELWRRFNFMLFVPQAVALVLIYPYLKEFYKKQIPLVITLISSVALIYTIAISKKSVISIGAYNDLSNISNHIEDPEKTIIITRHGLEWWVVWQLNTNIAQPQIKIDEAIIAKYDEILIITQKKGRFILYPGPDSPFNEPSVPENSPLLYSSDYFDVYNWSSQ